MTKRAATKYPQDPHQWYREPKFTVEQIFDSLDLGGGVIFDPSCGKGNTLDVARARGYLTFGTDIVDRTMTDSRHGFRRANFLRLTSFPFDPGGRRVSILNNPPYGRVGDVSNMGERFVIHALDHFRERCEHMAFILPIEFMAGQDRFFDIYERRKPRYSMICCQRPSMPPGAAVEDLGDAAYKGGMADYCVLVWTREPAPYCETIFMRPTVSNRPPAIEQRTR